MTKSKSYICPRHNMYKTFNDEDRLIDIVKCGVEFPPETKLADSKYLTNQTNFTNNVHNFCLT